MSKIVVDDLCGDILGEDVIKKLASLQGANKQEKQCKTAYFSIKMNVKEKVWQLMNGDENDGNN